MSDEQSFAQIVYRWHEIMFRLDELDETEAVDMTEDEANALDGERRALQQELAVTEDRIAAARRFYNGNVRDFTVLRDSFPSSLIARMTGYAQKDPGYFELDADAERVVGVKVKHLVPSDYRLALQALNQGRPLALENHNKLAAAYRDLARDLANLETEAPVKPEPTSISGRLTGRG